MGLKSCALEGTLYAPEGISCAPEGITNTVNYTVTLPVIEKGKSQKKIIGSSSEVLIVEREFRNKLSESLSPYS